MTHTYLPVGVSGDAMDVLSETVNDRVYFAGEVRRTKSCFLFPAFWGGGSLILFCPQVSCSDLDRSVKDLPFGFGILLLP